MSFFATCVYLRRNLRAVWPPNASLYASSTCVHLQLLAGPFDQGFNVIFWNEIPLKSVTKMTWLKIYQYEVLFNEWSFELLHFNSTFLSVWFLSQYVCQLIYLLFRLLSEAAGDEGKKQFLQEIDLMKQIGFHRNVLGMLGYWVRSEPILLILEYVPHGDLLKWLRKKRQVRNYKIITKTIILLVYFVRKLSIQRFAPS